jgi:class 3 adenylate cyclase/predicted ATPase
MLDNDIDFEVLPEITDDDLKELGISIGHRRKILAAIKRLDTSVEPVPRTPDDELKAPDKSVTDNAEHRQLTVLFCDLVGSTELSQSLNSEDLREVMIAYQTSCKAAIERHKGFIARYMGDGLLVYFGYPRAHEDDAQLAIRAGLAIVESVRELDNETGRVKGVALSVRVGIATGPVIVGDLIGEGSSQESAVVGETPNLAARIQGIADPNQVLISPATYRLARGFFQCESRGLMDLKGISEPVEIWQTTEEMRTDSRFESSNKENLTPLIGRDEELAILKRRWSLSREGKGQVVFITGEPGIGKSRLIQALREEASSDSLVHVRYQCSQHHIHSPLYPILSHFEFAAGIANTDTGDEKLDKLAGLLDRLGDNNESHMPLLASLLSIPLNGRYQPFQGDPRQQRQAVLAMLQYQFELLSSSRPILCLFEDVHWIDPSSMELIDRLVERIRELPVLLILTYRASFDCPWTGLSHTSLISLNRIARDETLAIVEKLSARHSLSDKLIEHIVSRTDGVPLFVEEMTKMLLESDYNQPGKSNEPDSEIRPPETLRDSLMARLDRLGSAKSVAQVCSVIGRSVNYTLLEKVADLQPEQLNNLLRQLTDSELMSCRGAPPHTEYTFKHALIQDTAYQSMLRSKRSAIHSRSADAIHEYFPAEFEQHPEIIAHHYLMADRKQLALDYFEKAAARTLGQSNYAEGIYYLNQALEIIRDEPESPQRNEREIRIQTSMGGAMIATKGFAHPETGATYARAAELVKLLGGDTTRFNPVRYGVYVFHLVRSELQLAHELAADFVAASESQSNPTEHLVAYRTMGICLAFMGRWEESIFYLDKALALYDIEQHRSLAVTYAQDPRISALTLKSWALLHLGRFDEALNTSDLAVAEANTFQHLHTTAYTLGLTGTMFHQYRGDLKRARQGADALVDLCTKQPVPLWTNLAFCLQGWAIGMEGDISTGIKQLDVGYDGFVGTGAHLFMSYYSTLKAEVYVNGGNHDMAVSCLERARELQDANEEGWFAADLCRIYGDLCRKMDLTGRADAEYQAGIKVALDHGDLLNLLRCTMGLAEMARNSVEKQAMRMRLEDIYRQFSEGSDSQDLVRAKALLDSLG